MSNDEKLIDRIEQLEAQCRHFGRQFEMWMIHQDNVDNLALEHEAKIAALEGKDGS